MEASGPLHPQAHVLSLSWISLKCPFENEGHIDEHFYVFVADTGQYQATLEAEISKTWETGRGGKH